MLVDILGAAGLLASLVWLCLLVLTVLPRTRPTFVRVFGSKPNRGLDHTLLMHLLGGILGISSMLLHVLFLHESNGTIKTALMPFGSGNLWLLMASGLGCTLIMSLGVPRTSRIALSFLLGYGVAVYFITPDIKALQVGVQLAFNVLGLVPLFILKTFTDWK